MSYRDRRLCKTCTDGSSHVDGGMTNQEMDALAKYVRQERTRREKIEALRTSGRCESACDRAGDLADVPIGHTKRPPMKPRLSAIAARAESLRKQSKSRRESSRHRPASTANIGTVRVSTKREAPHRSRSRGTKTSTSRGDTTFWELIDQLDWVSDRNTERIRETMMQWPQTQRDAFDLTLSMKVFELTDRFKGTVPWQNIDQLMGEVVASGEDFYNSINANKLRRMHRNESYDASFLYATDVEPIF